MLEEGTMNEAFRKNAAALLEAIAAKKERLDALRPLSPEALANLEHYYNIELTYASNAIEGNTLSPVETTLVIEKGITVGGKPLKDHLEALDHYEAMQYIRELGRHAAPLTEGDIRALHSLVVQRSRPDIAGRYADLPRYVRTETGRHAFPPPAGVPPLMSDFAAWLRQAPDTPETAFTAHRRLVDIHPFNDGNGRTARLLMNVVLIRGGYPPVAVRPEDRLVYIHALQEAQAGQGTDRFDILMHERLDATLGEYLSALNEAQPATQTPDTLEP
jgi:Fic family protein